MKPYNKLSEEDKQLIISTYYNDYEYGVTTFKEISESINVSWRAFKRVLKEANINTMRRNKYTLNESYFKVVDTEAKAYLLGVLYSDGCLTDTNYIALQQSDTEAIELFIEETRYNGEVRQISGLDSGGFSTKDSLMYRINFSSKEMANDLRNLGMKQSKDTNKLPNIPEELMHHFIRGYFDGDGGFYISTSTSYYGDKKYSYLNPIFSIICTIPFSYELKKYFDTKFAIKLQTVDSKSDNMVYVETRSRENCLQLYSHLYIGANHYFKRKHDKWQEWLATRSSNIT